MPFSFVHVSPPQRTHHPHPHLCPHRMIPLVHLLLASHLRLIAVRQDLLQRERLALSEFLHEAYRVVSGWDTAAWRHPLRQFPPPLILQAQEHHILDDDLWLPTDVMERHEVESQARWYEVWSDDWHSPWTLPPIEPEWQADWELQELSFQSLSSLSLPKADDRLQDDSRLRVELLSSLDIDRLLHSLGRRLDRRTVTVCWLWEISIRRRDVRSPWVSLLACWDPWSRGHCFKNREWERGIRGLSVRSWPNDIDPIQSSSIQWGSERITLTFWRFHFPISETIPAWE